MPTEAEEIPLTSGREFRADIDPYNSTETL